MVLITELVQPQLHLRMNINTLAQRNHFRHQPIVEPRLCTTAPDAISPDDLPDKSPLCHQNKHFAPA